MSLIRNGEEMGLQISETSGWIFCCILPAESAEICWTYIIHHPDVVYRAGSETERTRNFWMQMIIYRNVTLAVNNGCMVIGYN
jgi:hypothetical protein